MVKRRGGFKVCFTVGILCSFWCGRASGQLYYHPISLGTGETQASGSAVNDNGMVAGNGLHSSPSYGEVFRWSTSNGFELLTDTAGTTRMNQVFGITAGNLIVGAAVGTDNFSHAATWTPAAKMQMISTSNPKFEAAHGVSADGTILAGEGELPQVGVRYDGSLQAIPLVPTMTRAGAYAVSGNGNYVVGTASTNTTNEAYRYSTGGGLEGLGFVSGLPCTAATASNADGSVIVGYDADTFITFTHDIIWRQGIGMTELGDLPGGTVDSKAYGVSADGSIVVGTSNTANGPEAFIWDATNGMRRLADVLAFNPDAGYTLTSANGISPNGLYITGSALNRLTGKTEAFEVSPDFLFIPEPASLSFLAIGVSICVRWPRRRRAT